VGATTQATATRSAAGAELSGRTVTWASSAANVATVSATGVVTAVGAGTATITATSEGQSGTAALTVTPPPVATVSVSLASASIVVGATTQATAVTRSAAGAEVTGRTVTWSSSATGVATVSGSGLVTAVGVGSATITATSEGQGGSATLTVTQVPVASITFAADSIDVPIRARAQLAPTVRDAAGNMLTGRTIIYQTSNANFVTVSATGEVRSILPGAATVTATVEGRSATVRVNGSVADLNRIVDSVRAARSLPAMVHREGLVALGAGGTRRATGSIAVTVNDKWHLGSNTKAMTGMLAGMAVDAGVLTWQRTVDQAFPDLAATTLAAYKPVTLSELLSHTGGLVNTVQGANTSPTNLAAARTAWADFVLRQPPNNARGMHYYSNPSFGIAGAMVERAWSSTYEALMSSRIFQPLGITDAGWGPTTAAGANDQPVGHRLQGNTWTPCEACDNPSGLSSAGTVHMSLRSWARIIQELLLADAGRSPRLTQATARYLTTNAVPANGGGSYGMGWGVTPGAQRLVGHDGSNNLNHSRALVYLDGGVAFLLTTNAADLAGGRSGDALAALQLRLDNYWQSGR
jgi:CubicO group peptidase (beta-lactamase class C family)